MTSLEVVLTVGALAVACAVASFMCVIIDRLPVPLDEPNEFGESWSFRPWGEVLGGTSRCSSCGAAVRPRDNVPVVSWLVLRGRCRDCGASIPAFHVWVEILVPAIVAVMLAVIGFGPRVLPVVIVVPLMVAIAVIDHRTLMIPTRLVWVAGWIGVAASAVAATWYGSLTLLAGGMFGIVAFAGPLFAVFWVRPDGIGFGDVRLAVVLGWQVGMAAALIEGSVNAQAAVIAGTLVSCTLLLSALIGIALALANGATRTTKVPFGPSLIAGTLVVLTIADPLIDLFR